MLRRVQTKYGEVEGLPSADPRITVFKGIPFAQPPVGENRWRAPKPQKPWEGVLKAYSFAPISFQDIPGLGGNIYDGEWNVDPEIPMSEDCLYLNIWSGAKRSDEKLPVLVWFFGGGFQWGNTQEMEFDGERLARRGIIVVSVNYRLASLGFLAHPELTKEQPEAPANFGHLDQKAGLHWVYENIEAFGGDPSQITIAGQSAGGGSVMAQMACKENFDILKGAVVFSGMITNPFEPAGYITPCPLKEAEQKGVDFFKALGVSTLAEARKLSSEYIREKYNEYAQKYERMATTIDNVFIEGSPYELFCEGKTANIPVLSGNTTDEFHAFINCNSKDELSERAKELFGSKAEQFLSFTEVTKEAFGKYGDIPLVEYSVKSAFVKRERSAADKHVYYYSFDPDIPGADNPGTFHSVDLWFWFESISKASRPFVGRHFDLARKMANYFAAFVKTGNPNTVDNDGDNQPEWKAYTSSEKNEMIFTSDGPVTRIGTEGLAEFMANNLIENI